MTQNLVPTPLDYTSEDPEHFRIHVPHPDTEVILGNGPNGFSGFMARAANGGVFLGAGGFPFSIPTADASYEGFKKAHTTLTLGVSSMATLALFARTAYMGKEACAFSAVVNGLSLALGAIPGAVFAGMFDGTPTPEGNISMYGDKTVSLASALTVSMTGGVSASINGSVAASLNSVLSTSVNGVTAGVYGAYSATVSGSEAKLIGDSEVSVSSRYGVAKIEGTTIRVGNPSALDSPGTAYSGFMTGGQRGTKRIEVMAEDMISIEPGSAADKVTGPPTQLGLMKDKIHATSGTSAMTLDGNVVARAGRAVLAMAPNRIKLFLAAKPVHPTYDAIVTPAAIAHATDRAAAEKINEVIGSKKWLALLGGAVGTAVALPVALKEAHGGPATKAGIASGAAALGLGLGALTTLGVLSLIEKKLTATAQEAKKKLADSAYHAVFDEAVAAAKKDVEAQSYNAAAPKIDIDSTSITLSVGVSKMVISADGIEIKTAPGMSVTVNGQPFTNGVPGMLEVG